MNKFEAVLLFSPDLTANIIEQEEKDFKDQLSKIEGSVINNEDWGLRDLSYNIKSNKKAFYKFYQIEMSGNKLEDLKKTLNQNEKLLRYLFIKVNEHEKLPTKLIKN